MTKESKIMDKKENIPKMSVEIDGKIILEVEMDEANADWIRTAREERMKEEEDKNDAEKSS